PIILTLSPRLTSKETPSTARRPWKCLPTDWTLRNALFMRPPLWAAPAMPNTFQHAGDPAPHEKHRQEHQAAENGEVHAGQAAAQLGAKPTLRWNDEEGPEHRSDNRTNATDQCEQRKLEPDIRKGKQGRRIDRAHVH